MAKDASFDIYSTVEQQEVTNAVNQTNKEIAQRYDFKGSKSTVEIEGEGLKILADDDFKLRAVTEILKTKLITRKVPVKNLIFQNPEAASGGTIRQLVRIQNGIEQDKAKEVVKEIKALNLKVQAQIEGDRIRVSGKNRDDLQTVIQALKGKDFGVELQFGNYR